MFTRTMRPLLLVCLLASYAGAQKGLGYGQLNETPAAQMSTFDSMQQDLWMVRGEGEKWHKGEAPSDSASRLDLQAPWQARREYEKGVVFLYKKNSQGAVERLTKCISIYPSFVAAHNALGSAYLDLGQNEQAQKEFAQAVLLDNHLPYSYLNLGRAQLALKNYSEAQESMQKASGLAPLDLQILMALTYTEFLNHDYTGAITTAHQVHGRKHETAAIVHYFAAAAWQGQNNLQETQNELATFLTEAPTSPVADSARQMIEQIKERQNHPAESVEVAYAPAPSDLNAAPATAAAQRILHQFEQQRQVAEAESESDCAACAGPNAAGASAQDTRNGAVSHGYYARVGPSSWILRSTVNEVAVFFAATDHGKSVSDLTQKEVLIRDDGKPPATVVSFRNESQLPLRLGLVIDTSSSITNEFSFERKAASSFLRKTVTDQHDLAFVVGFSNAVLMVQDFTGDAGKISHGIDQLAPAGGTALWDAVKFASEKLASRPEQQPVARILVVISDGEDNSSSATLKQAIESAERNEVIVYTVSTKGFGGDRSNSAVADRAMKALASRSGGAAFFPSSLHDLDRRLADLQEVIRSRYLISYKPAHFETDDRYRSIAIEAERSGHKLHVYARRGYFANARPAY